MRLEQPEDGGLSASDQKCDTVRVRASKVSSV